MENQVKISITKEELADAVAKAVEGERKYAKKFAFTGSASDEKSAKKAETALKLVKFVNAVSRNDRNTINEIVGDRAKAMNETTSADGGYLVPIEFEKGVMAMMSDYNELRRYARVVQMTSNVMKLNTLVSKVSVAKVGELAAITASWPTYGEPVLTAEKYAGSTTLSSEIEEDAETDVIANLQMQFAEQFAYAEQNSLVNSSVAGSVGLLKHSGVTPISLITGTTFSKLTFDDLSAMQKALFAVNKTEAQNGVFVMSFTAYDILRTLKSSGSGDYLLPSVPTEDAPARIWGRPVVVINEMPTSTATATKFVVYGDLSKHLIIGDRRALRMKINTSGTSAEGINLNSYDGSELVLTKRTAQVIANPTGIVTLATN